ncbi:MAG: 4Fe-4S dicluster domain-containing protein [Candidatus Omnitrophica bacterium]|nr:4Fe-4S dicluster domain-containing protein [Candidatus Omnitrophota bacterium]
MDNSIIETDILIVGGGSAGIAFAIHYADLVRRYNEDPSHTVKLPDQIMLLEKGGAIGHHSLSGAVINPVALRELLPDVEPKDYPLESPVTIDETMFFTKTGSIKLPFEPPYMGNKGNSLVMLGKLVRWMAEIAEKKGVQIFPGFSAHELVFENNKLVGIRTGATGVDHHGKPMPNYQPPTEVRAKIIIMAEGTRGSLTRELIKTLDLAKGRNPQIYSLGVKELWEIPEGAFEKGRVVHSLGYPLKFDQFGGGFIYGLSKTLVAVGYVAGLDIKDPTFDTHRALQIYKKHPFVRAILQKGKIVRYGAKTIPEGGLFALPQLYHDHVMIVGDAAGFLAMPSLKGVHLGIRSAMLAAQAAVEAFKNKDTSKEQLSLYEKLFQASSLYKELYPVRNFRQAFKNNLFFGAMQFGTQLVTMGRGLSLGGRLTMGEDRTHYNRLSECKGKAFGEGESFIKDLNSDKETSIFFSGTKHDEAQPSHIRVPSSLVCEECIQVYGGPCQHFCPAQVFEISVDSKTGKKGLKLHPSNCVHCKTCDIKDPYSNVIWETPYGGDGPEYENM